MADSKIHDRINAIASIGTMGIAYYCHYSLDVVLSLGFTTFLGGLYFSPDLDSRSIPYKRWGWLRWWWIGYQKWFGHRGWGHCPVLGTVSRLVWTLPFWVPLIYWIRPEKKYLIVILIGFEISALIHEVVDFLTKISVKKRK